MGASEVVRRAGAALIRAREGAPPEGARVPVALLRAPTGSRVGGADWKVEPDGVLGRVLEVLAGAGVSYPLTLAGAVSFTFVARLYPHDWRDLNGSVRAVVSVTTPNGLSELWSGTLHAGDRGRPSGLPVEVTLPASATALHLTVDPMRHPPAEDPLERAIFVEPALWDPSAPPSTAPVSHSGSQTGPRAAEDSQSADRTPADRPPLDHPPPHPADAAIHTGPSDGPLFSVLVPVHDPPLQMLREAVESVGAQTFGDWELCLVDDGSRDPEVIAALEGYTVDPRIRLHRHESARGISAATNAALELARGRYVALLDHDDTLAPDALEQIAATLAADPTLDMVYSDEDIVSGGVVLEPHPKPGWSPEHMDALMYTCHLGVYRRTLARELGGFDTRFDGCQDFDFVLRLMERTDRVAHVPRILYHWRAHPASTATFGGDAKPHAFLAQPAAIAAHLERTGVQADVRHGYLPGIHRIVHRVDPDVSVAIALAVDGADGLAAAVRSWGRQSHRSWRVVLAAPPSLHPELGAALADAGLDEHRYELLAARGRSTPDARTAPYSASAAASTEALADAAERAAELADHVLLLQTPAAGLTADWLTRLIGYGFQPGIAGAGPLLLGSGGSIAQAGVALPEGLPLHLLHDLPAVSAPPAVTNVSAVSGALLTPAAVLREAGPPDPAFGELALIEYCLRATESGRRVVFVPDARLRMTGPDPTINDLPAMWALRARWADRGDRYYNAGYLTDRGDLAMRPS
jgi:GT2 family glycosyltransferase